MANTLIEQLDFTVTGANANLLTKLSTTDPMESPGSLFLLEPMHDSGQWPAGVPVNNTRLNNVFADTAKILLGTSVSDNVNPLIRVPSGFSGSAGKLERTVKGGLHGIVSQVNSAQGSGPGIEIPPAIVKYLLDHSKGDSANHTFYISLWHKITRYPATGYNNSTLVGINGNGQQTNSAFVNVAIPQPSSTFYPQRPANGAGTNVWVAQNQTPAGITLVPRIFSITTKGWYNNNTVVPYQQPGDGTNVSVTGPFAGGVIPWGSSAAVNGVSTTGATSSNIIIDASSISSNLNKAGSWALYRVYIEDLTISKRTHAQVYAMDEALFNTAFSAGGKYYNDTYTDPTTIA